MAASIRIATEHDAEQVAAIYAPYVRETAISFETDPPDAHEMQQRIRSVSARWPWLVCENGREIAGYAYASEHHERAAYQWSADVAIYVRQGSHRAGIGRALYGALLPLLKLQGFFNAYAGIALPNPASVGLHEALGFKTVGVYRAVGFKLGVWHDVGWWHLALQDAVRKPEPVLGIDALQKRAEWPELLERGRRELRA